MTASSDSVVGANNIMQVLELCNMSEFIYETEQAALKESSECREHADEMWPETRDLNVKKKRRALRMITNMLKTGTQGEVLASKSCTWIKEWAQQWDLNVAHYRYKKKSHSTQEDGTQGEGSRDEQQERERLTQVCETPRNERHEARHIEEHKAKLKPGLQQLCQSGSQFEAQRLRQGQVEQGADEATEDGEAAESLVMILHSTVPEDDTAPCIKRKTRSSSNKQKSQALEAAAEHVIDPGVVVAVGADGEGSYLEEQVRQMVRDVLTENRLEDVTLRRLRDQVQQRLLDPPRRTNHRIQEVDQGGGDTLPADTP